MAKKVAVIGAGASGLPGIKCCLDEGLEPVCFERTDSIGGLWHYTDYSRDGDSCVMKSTVINTSKEMMCYSDYPIPASFPNYMHNTKVLEYFHSYADNFNLKKYIRFETNVRKVSKAADFPTSGRWDLDVEDKKTGKVTKECYDAVLVCTGHHADKNIPNFPGMEDFQGKIVHSHDFKDSVGYEDKRVVVIGIGNSGGDAAVELSRVASQAFLSTRRGSWIINRIADNGLPVDLVITRRIGQDIVNRMPYGLVNSLLESRLNHRFDHATYSLKPKHRYFAQHPTVNDELPNRIACGAVIVKPDIRRFTKTGVEFEDGTVEENIDVVFLGTGYTFGFPFIDSSVFEVKKNFVNLFKYVFPPDLAPSTLAIIGCIQPWGAIMPLSELQCRWATRVFKGLEKLPSSDAMRKDIKGKRDAMQERYVESQRHTIQVDWIPYMDELAEQCGCKPNIWEIFKKDVKLGVACYTDPCTPYQYRLMGPNSWEGARDAILSTWDRVYKPLKTREISQDEKGGVHFFFKIIFVLLIAFLLKYILGF